MPSPATPTLALAAIAALAASVASAGASDAPAFKPVRSDEDYGYLRTTGPLTGADRLRFIPLNASERAYLTLGGEARLRVDAVDAPRFGVPGETADTYALARFLFSADLRLGDKVRAYGALGLHRDIDKIAAPSATDRDGLDLQLLFVDLRPTQGLRLRAGRQELMLSQTQRFIAVREGPNIRQAFDGVRVTFTPSAVKLDGFYLQPVVADPGAFDDRRNPGQRFYGLYGSGSLTRAATLDLYALGLERDDARFGAVSGDERRQALGARLGGKVGAFDYEAEGMVQRGRFAGQPIRAWGGSVGAGYTLRRPWSPRLGLRLDAGSGDRDPADGRLQTFNPLFPRGAYFNESALTSWSNLRAARASLGLSPAKGAGLEISYMARDRATPGDAIYLQPMQVLPGGAASRARAVGNVLQIDASWQVARNVKLQAQVAHQEAGAAVTAAGGRDTDFAMAIIQYRF